MDGPIMGRLPLRHSCFAAALALLALVLPACSSGNDEPAAAAPPEVDSRFATAEALLAHFNSLNTQLPPDLEGMLGLYYIETEFQRKQHDLLMREASSAFHDLDKVMYERFGEGYMDGPLVKRGKPPLKPCSAAKLVRTETRRAEGTFRDQWGTVRPLQLVEYDGRWWISGYTLEFRIDPKHREGAEAITDMLLSNDVDDSHIRPIIAAIRDGEINTAEAVHQAVLDAMKAKWDARQ